MMLLNPYRFAAGGDPYWSSVTALLHFDGADGATTATDEKGGTVTFSGAGPVISTAQSLAGGSSLYLPGTGYVTVGGPNADLGSGDFTVELFARHTSLSGTWRTLLSIPLDSGRLQIMTQSGIAGFHYGGVDANDVATLPLNGWVHVALVRQGTTLSLYVGGTRVVQYFGAAQRTVAGPLNLGRDTAAVFAPAICYHEDVRITKHARYSGASITPPAAPLPNS